MGMAFDLYKRTEIGDVTTYIRPYQTMSRGPLNGLNSMVISEEMVLTLPDASTVIVPLSTAEIDVTITDPNAVFNLIHPVTGIVTGTKTFAQLKIDMYSLYLHLAAIRDEEPEQFP